MIQRETKTDCKSYFKDKELYDSRRHSEYCIKLFGMTIYRRVEKYDCDVKEGKDNKPGFKNETT